jgi:LysR family hydrogen peroxide-inducible transcriptional activator
MAALPTIKQLRYLIALSEALSFTKAAERCFVGQSTLSAGLKELEDTLGAQLVERDRHSVSLTHWLLPEALLSLLTQTSSQTCRTSS